MKSNRTTLLVVLAAIVVVVIGVIAFVAAGGDDDPAADGDVPEETAEPVAVAGSALAPFSGSDDPAVGDAFPTFSGTGIDGRPLTIDAADGPMLVVFLAHWCPHCQRELPTLVDLAASGTVPEGVRLVAVTTSIDPSRGNYPPSAWLTGAGWEQPTLIDPDEAAAIAVGLTSFPFFIAVDADGEVVARRAGELDTETLQALVASVSPAR